jgi:hypothetical protein
MADSWKAGGLEPWPGLVPSARVRYVVCLVPPLYPCSTPPPHPLHFPYLTYNNSFPSSFLFIFFRSPFLFSPSPSHCSLLSLFLSFILRLFHSPPFTSFFAPFITSFLWCPLCPFFSSHVTLSCCTITFLQLLIY